MAMLEPKFNNEAIDFNSKPELRILKKKKTGTLKIFLCVIFVLLSFFMIILRYSQITKLNYDIVEIESKLTEQNAINSTLFIELDKITNLAEVRYIAETQLGMQKPDSYQIEYIEVPRGDNVSTMEPEETFADKMAQFNTSIKELFQNLKIIFA